MKFALRLLVIPILLSGFLSCFGQDSTEHIYSDSDSSLAYTPDTNWTGTDSLVHIVADNFDTTQFTKKWQFDGQLYSGNDSIMAKPIFSDYLDLKSDTNGLTYTFKAQNLGMDVSGNWVVINDETLMLFYDIPDESEIDEIKFGQGADGNIVYLYNDGVLIAEFTNAGIVKNQIVFEYNIEDIALNEDEDIHQLVLSSGASNLNFSYNADDFEEPSTMVSIVRGVLGLSALIFITFLFSSHKRKIDWWLVAKGLLMQLVFALLILKVPFVRTIFDAISGVFVVILDVTRQASIFLFGDLMDISTYGFIFAFQVLPTIVFFSALSALLYYLGILQRIVYVFAWVMSKIMNLSGAESLAAAANIFLGQTEAPLVVKPYLDKMTKSEILCLMTGGMATIAGGVFAAYVGFLGGADAAAQQVFATHLLSASIMSAPAAIVAAKILYPETEPEKIDTNVLVPRDKIGSNILDAISRGTTDGLKLAVNVGVMLLTFMAFMFLVNKIFFWAGDVTGVNEMIAESTRFRYDGLSLQYIFGIILSPVAWILGVPNCDLIAIGQLLGEKTILNEFVAYASLGTLKDAGIITSQKSIIIATYALCGFANFASIGIQIGGIGAIAPGQRKTLAAFGVKALIGGTVACFLTAVIAGMLV